MYYHNHIQQQFACLPARTVTERTPCRLASDCGPSGLGFPVAAIRASLFAQMSASSDRVAPIHNQIALHLAETNRAALPNQQSSISPPVPIQDSDQVTNPVGAHSIEPLAVLQREGGPVSSEKNERIFRQESLSEKQPLQTSLYPRPRLVVPAPGPALPRGNNGGGSTSSGMVCVLPSPTDQTTRLVRLMHSRPMAPAILFLGPIDDLAASVGVSDYIPRWPSIVSSQLPSILALFCT
ncbi:unnamed protein product [Protopolystoma xenopodis]|uniref:Uncharacterized protein n=1 Tax=Protopolystoma xenopodis TaxID=117903 RepID=A0A3S5B4L7_9PLAT|nr:unnamed protein product [Protopolystoma xenopodis]